MKSLRFLALICLSLLAPSLFGQTASTAPSSGNPPIPPAQIPEEARKHFVMGTTLFKDAKTAADFSQVETEFKQAMDLAPQWPEARYNLALAKEAAGDFSGAMADLRLYQNFKLSEAEARTVQDKLYALEAKQQKKVSEDAAKAAANAEEAKFGWLLGEWSYVSDIPIEHSPLYTMTGTIQAKKRGIDVEIGPINDRDARNGTLRATVLGLGKITWEVEIEDNRGCPVSNPLQITPTIGRDQRTIRYELPYQSGGGCQYDRPIIITLTHR